MEKCFCVKNIQEAVIGIYYIRKFIFAVFNKIWLKQSTLLAGIKFDCYVLVVRKKGFVFAKAYFGLKSTKTTFLFKYILIKVKY